MATVQKVLVRNVDAGDRPDVLACLVELQEAERAIEPRLRPGREMAEAYLAYLEGRCHDWAGALLVGELDGAVVGFAAVFTRVPFEELDEPVGEYALVHDLVVRATVRGRGYGRSLLRAAEDLARSAGATELRVSALSDNEAARRLYERSGFRSHLVTLRKVLGGG